jgi:hypothetical protein
MILLVIQRGETRPMSNKSKARNAADAAAAGVPRVAFSVAEFCAMHGISEGAYRRLRDQGIGPREVRVLRRVLITIEAATAWRKEREVEPETAA